MARRKRYGSEGIVFQSGGKKHLFLTNGSRVYSIPVDVAQTLEHKLMSGNSNELKHELAELGLSRKPYIGSKPPRGIPLHNISLAITQKCNLGCSYCYASGGSFGQVTKNMPLDIAKQSVDRVVENTNPGERCNIAFMGGEPLFNRTVLRTVTEYARQQASKRNIHVGFSITTNGTLITEEDAEFFEENGFAVTLSLDGPAEDHDILRPFKGGGGSFSCIINRIKKLLILQNKMQVSTRVTVTPQNLNLCRTLESFIQMGFHSVGFAPMLSAPNGKMEMNNEALQRMLEQMIECADNFECHTIAGKRYPFSNVAVPLNEIHKGTHRPYPCGAGAGYMGVSADGDFFSCHRFVDNKGEILGSSKDGVDMASQANWLAQRHVDLQSPCANCWVRYLCGGGCHHEVRYRGRPACDFIRGWITHCLSVYVRLRERRPDFFSASKSLKGSRN